MDGNALKALVLQKAKSQIQERLNNLRTSIQAAQQSANEEGKSSMGDKYETARAMAHLNTEMLGTQLRESEKIIQALERLQDSHSEQLSHGCLAHFTNGWFWIAPGGGKLSVENHDIFWISTHAPWAKHFSGMKVGEVREFNRQSWKLEALY